METITVLVADDNDSFRQTISKLFALEDDIQMVAEAKDGLDVVKKASDLVPNIVLLDLMMPEKNGIEAANLIKKEHPDIVIAILTVLDDVWQRAQAARAGVDAYILKDTPFDQLVQKIKRLVGDTKTRTK